MTTPSSHPSSPARLRLAVDIGGTFTDTVLVAGEVQVLATAKTLTAHHNPTESALQGVRQVVAEAGVPLRDIQPSRAAQDAYDLETSDFRQCPHCGRTFNPKAWERHVPHCAKTRNRPKPPPGRRALGRGAARRTGSMNF